MIPVDAADELMNTVMSGIGRPEVNVTLIPGHDHAAELEDIKLEMRELVLRDLPDVEMDAELARLRAERDRLLAQPSVPDRWERRPTGRTYGQVWQALDLAGRRAWLRDTSKFTVYGGRPDMVTRVSEGAEDPYPDEMLSRFDDFTNDKAALVFEWTDGDDDDGLVRGLPGDDDDE